jgi:hypothetical protein
VWSNLLARSQNAIFILFPPLKQIRPISPYKTKPPRHPPAVPAPPPRTLVDCGVFDISDRAVRSNSPARLQIMTSILPTPPAKKFDQNPLTKRRCHTIPRPFQPPPPPPCTLVDCGVVEEVGDRAVRSNSPAWLQIALYPNPPVEKFDQNPLRKTMLPHHPPAVPAPTPAYAR